VRGEFWKGTRRCPWDTSERGGGIEGSSLAQGEKRVKGKKSVVICDEGRERGVLKQIKLGGPLFGWLRKKGSEK